MRTAKRRFVTAAAILLLMSSVAQAAPVNATALEMYKKGEYLAAAQAAAGEGGGVGLALAARATLADATLREQTCLPCLHDAEEFARAAIAADADYAEGYIELAAALGYEARLMG